MALTKLALVFTSIVIAGACGGSSSPTSPGTPAPTPAPQTPAQAGVWKGAFEISTCSGPSALFGCQPSPDNFVLRLGPEGGVLQIETRIWDNAPAIAVNLTPRSGDGTVLTGSSSGRNLDVQLTLTEVGTTLHGTVHYTVNGTSGPVVKDGRILYANRDSTIYPGRFEGQWVGFPTRTQCSGDCGEYSDPVLQSGGVRLYISQAGGTVTGTLNRSELTGSANGNSFNASRRFAVQPSDCRRQWDDGMTCRMDLDLSGTVDSLDRLHGSMTYRVEGVDSSGRPFVISATATLDGLVRWP